MTQRKSTEPKAVEAPTAESPPQNTQEELNFVPAIQGVSQYFSIGKTDAGLQLYSFDIHLKQWRIMQANEMQQIMVAQGMPNSVIQTLMGMQR